MKEVDLLRSIRFKEKERCISDSAHAICKGKRTVPFVHWCEIRAYVRSGWDYPDDGKEREIEAASRLVPLQARLTWLGVEEKRD